LYKQRDQKVARKRVEACLKCLSGLFVALVVVVAVLAYPDPPEEVLNVNDYYSPDADTTIEEDPTANLRGEQRLLTEANRGEDVDISSWSFLIWTLSLSAARLKDPSRETLPTSIYLEGNGLTIWEFRAEVRGLGEEKVSPPSFEVFLKRQYLTIINKQNDTQDIKCFVLRSIPQSESHLKSIALRRLAQKYYPNIYKTWTRIVAVKFLGTDNLLGLYSMSECATDTVGRITRKNEKFTTPSVMSGIHSLVLADTLAPSPLAPLFEQMQLNAAILRDVFDVDQYFNILAFNSLYDNPDVNNDLVFYNRTDTGKISVLIHDFSAPMQKCPWNATRRTRPFLMSCAIRTMDQTLCVGDHWQPYRVILKSIIRKLSDEEYCDELTASVKDISVQSRKFPWLRHYNKALLTHWSMELCDRAKNRRETLLDALPDIH